VDVPAKQPKKVVTRKLTNMEREELKALPHRIEQLEAELETLQQAMADPAFYQQNREVIAGSTARAEAIPHELEKCFERWEELERL